MRTRTRLRQPVSRRAGGFTLIELLVVMGIIVILIGLTVISVGAVARESRLSSGTNTVKAALGKEVAIGKPGTLAGFLIRDADLAKLGGDAQALARQVARGVSAASGIKVKPDIAKLPGGGGILVGYILPRVMK